MPPFHCTVSADGRHLAVRRERTVTVHAIAHDAPSLGAVIAETQLPHADGTLAFCGAYLVDLAIVDGRTVVTTMTFPKVRQNAVEIPIATTLLAETGRHLLVAAAEIAHVVWVHNETPAYAPLRMPSKISWAAGIGEDQILTSGTRGI